MPLVGGGIGERVGAEPHRRAQAEEGSEAPALEHGAAQQARAQAEAEERGPGQEQDRAAVGVGPDRTEPARTQAEIEEETRGGGADQVGEQHPGLTPPGALEALQGAVRQGLGWPPSRP